MRHAPLFRQSANFPALRVDDSHRCKALLWFIAPEIFRAPLVRHIGVFNQAERNCVATPGACFALSKIKNAVDGIATLHPMQYALFSRDAERIHRMTMRAIT